jgi:diguanylate cyclase (GGDEF)-like protein
MAIENILLRDIADNENVSVEIHSQVNQLLQVMHKNKKGVVVVLQKGRPIGIVTERDIVSLLYRGVNLDEEVQRFARKPLVVAKGKRSVGYALSLMVENNIRRLVVVDDSDNFVGVVTQEELLNHLEEDYYRSAIRVKHIFDQLKDLIGASRDETIKEVLKKMVEHQIGAVPILENGVAIGVITEKDVLKLASDKVSLQEHIIEHMSSPVISAQLETRLVDVVKTMNTRSVRRLVVEGDDGLSVGMITNRDLVRNFEGDYNQFLEMKLKHSKDVFNLLPEMLFEAIDIGSDQLVVWANEKVLSRFGKTIIDQPMTELVPPEKWRDIYDVLIDQKKVEDVRFKRLESTYEFSGFYLPLDKTTEKGRIELILRDITEEVVLATTDPLTKIYNRRYMNEFLTMETDRSKRSQKEFAVVLVDVDDFKKVNDTYGHLSGDVVLKAIVGGIIGGTRQYDIVGRYGGEEFLIIMPEVDKATAVEVAERMRRNIENHEVEILDDEKVKVTASFGIAVFPEDGISPDDLLVKADERLYKAKWEGKNRVVHE